MKSWKMIANLFFAMLKIGAFTFGGGYAMIALLENEFVEKKKPLQIYKAKKLPSRGNHAARERSDSNGRRFV